MVKATRTDPKDNQQRKEYTAGDLEQLAGEITLRVILPNGAGYTFSLQDVAAVDPDDIQGELIRHSARYAFYARLHVDTRIAMTALRGKLTELETAVDLTIRAELEAELTVGPRGGVPKVSETEIKRRVSLNDQVIKMRQQVADLDAQLERLAVARETLTHRREMLTAVAMFRAPEGTGGPAERAQYRLRR